MIKYNDEELKKLEEDFKKIDLLKGQKQALLEISHDFKGLAQQTFNDKKSPFGKKWEPSESNPDTLVKSGDLFRSVDSLVRKNEVLLFAGENLDYAKIHNNGIGFMPMRQFIPNKGKIPKKWMDLAKKNIEKYMIGEIKKRGKK